MVRGIAGVSGGKSMVHGGRSLSRGDASCNLMVEMGEVFSEYDMITDSLG